MKKLLLFLLINSSLLAQDVWQINIGAIETEKMKVLLLYGKGLEDISEVLKKDLEFSGQFDIQSELFEKIRSKNDILGLFDKGYSMAIFLNKGRGVEWRIYDTMQAEMLMGKLYKKQGDSFYGWAHNIADDIWSQLAGQEGFFTSKISFSESVFVKGKKALKYIYICDYDGGNKQLLVKTPTINIASKWNNNKINPLVLYSECTSSNMRLVSINMNKEKKVVTTSDGLNMQTNFNLDDQKVVLCSSRLGSSQIYLYQYDKENKKVNVKRITKNKGNNVSPILLENDDIVFCSDFETNSPQIYCLHAENNFLERLTSSGYCACPGYTSKSGGKIAYSKIVSGFMQIFIYDMVNKKHEQMTFDKSNKEEPSWSPCGNYLVFSMGIGAYSRLAILSLLTKELKYITSSDKNVSYPCWSPKYKVLPCIK